MTSEPDTSNWSSYEIGIVSLALLSAIAIIIWLILNIGKLLTM